MQILDLGAMPLRPVDAHSSRGFSVGAFGVTADAALVAVSVRAGGTIGRHPAAGRQLLVVLSGEASVSGGDGVVVTIGAGSAALWSPGESHETRTTEGFTALVIEGDLDVRDPRERDRLDDEGA